MTISPSAQLLRGFAVDFLTCHNVAAVETIMEPDYSLSISGHVFEGRDDQYLPVTEAQLEQFPGLCVTVHDTVIGPDAVAMRFTEHGASQRHGGRLSTWGGITLFRIKDGRLHQGWAEEDYFARKRQLSTGIPDVIKAPCPSPWDGEPLPPDKATESVARNWIVALPSAPAFDEISAQGPRFGELVVIESISISTLFSAGSRTAFHAVCAGHYKGGFDDIDPARIGDPVKLPLAGLLTVSEGQVTNAQICADRLGLHRSLMRPI
jgi:predicted ester cyclase